MNRLLLHHKTGDAATGIPEMFLIPKFRSILV